VVLVKAALLLQITAPLFIFAGVHNFVDFLVIGWNVEQFTRGVTGQAEDGEANKNSFI
jgi:hypothetical protein